MPHEYPSHAPLATETSDPKVLNKLIQTIAMKSAGDLNEHDVAAGAIPEAQVDPTAYYAVYTKQVEVDPQWDPTTVGYPNVYSGGGMTGAAFVSDVVGWQDIEVYDPLGGGAKLQVHKPFGDDLLFVVATIQHASFDLEKLQATPSERLPSRDPERLEYAIHLDGSVIESSITGSLFFPCDPSQETYRNRKPVVAGTENFDTRHQDYQHDSCGINSNVMNTRLHAVFPVTEGSHVVGVKAKRWPWNSYAVDNGGYGSAITLYNRQLMVLRLKGHSKGDGTASDFTVDVFEAGDTVSSANLSQALRDVRDELNALSSPSFQRGALRNEHLPSIVAGVASTSYTPAALVPVNTAYPGFGVPTGSGPPGTAWTQVSDGAGNPLQVTPGLDVATTPGVLIVFANVQVRTLARTVMKKDQNVYASFEIRYKDQTGTWNHVAQSEGTLHNRNSHTYFAGDTIAEVPGYMEPVDDDMPLFWVVDTRTLTGVTDITDIDVVVSTHHEIAHGGAGGVTVQTQACALSCFFLRGVEIA